MANAIKSEKGSLLVALLTSLAILGIVATVVLSIFTQQTKIATANIARATEREAIRKVRDLLEESQRGAELIPGTSEIRLIRSLPPRELPGIRDSRYLPHRTRSVILKLQILDRSQIFTRPISAESVSRPVFCHESINGRLTTPARSLPSAAWLLFDINGKICIHSAARIARHRNCPNLSLTLAKAHDCYNRGIDRTLPTESALMVAQLRDQIAIYLDRAGCLRRYSFLSNTHQPLACGTRWTKLQSLRSSSSGAQLSWIVFIFTRHSGSSNARYAIGFPPARSAEKVYAEILDSLV